MSTRCEAEARIVPDMARATAVNGLRWLPEASLAPAVMRGSFVAIWPGRSGQTLGGRSRPDA